MTRDELLDHLRRELDSKQWAELRPDTRLTEVEERVDTLVETLEEIRAAYDDTSGACLLDALDDLAAALSYFRTDLGHAFSETTRLTNELRTTLRRLESDTPDNQMTIGLAGEESEADEASAEDREDEWPSQTSLFGE
jgi:hypothetical protein